MELEQLKKQVAELMKWKAERERQQLNFPVDAQSIELLRKYVMLKEKFGAVDMAGLGNVTLLNQVEFAGTSSKTQSAVTSVGDETVTNQGGAESSLNTQLWLQDQPSSSGLWSFLFAYRKPIYKNKEGSTISVTSAGSTMSDTNKNWTADELAGSYIMILNSSGTHQFTRQIASNTSTQITIDGTWPSTVNDGKYFVYMPVFLGSADAPWRQAYILGEDVSSGGTGIRRRALRLGFGTTSGADVIGIYFGTDTPENNVTANIGSLYLRTDGSTSTTLYVKTSGTGNTGWTAK